MNIKNSNYLQHQADNNDEFKDQQFLINMYDAIDTFINSTDPFDYEKLLEVGTFIQQQIQNVKVDMYIQIFSYNDYSMLSILTNLLSKNEVYSTNNELIYIICSIISQISQSLDIDISEFSTQSFFNCIFEKTIPNLVKNNAKHSLLPVLKLVSNILKDNPNAITNFLENIQYVIKMISIFGNWNTEHQNAICQVLNQILNDYKDDIRNFNNDEENTFSILRDFIEDKMFDFEVQPFYILDLITISIKKRLVSLNKLNIINSESFIKHFCLKNYYSLLNVISTAFLMNPQTDKEREENEQFISTFQWNFFSPFISYVLNQKSIEKELFDDSILLKLCDTFYLILKRSKFLSLRSKKELNLPSILLFFVTSSDYTFKVRESSLQALIALAYADIGLVFFDQNNKFDMNENYLTILIEFLEYDSNDDFLEIIINAIIYLIIHAEHEVECRIKKRFYPSGNAALTKKVQSYESADALIVDILLNLEVSLKEKIEAASLNVLMSNEACQALLETLKRFYNKFYQLIKNK